jgi:dsRNA-specific ribonuclease
MAHYIDIEKAQSILQHAFADKELLRKALKAPARGINTESGREYADDGNRWLALLGQSALQLVILEASYKRNIDRGT